MLWSMQGRIPGHGEGREEQWVDLAREAAARPPSLPPSILLAHLSWVVTSEFTGTLNPACIRPMRITLCMSYACLFNFKCSVICYRHTSCKGLLLSRALDVPGNR